MSGVLAYLVMCVACGGDWPGATMYVTEVPHPNPFHCKKCAAGLLSAEEQLSGLRKGNHPVVGLVGAAPEARWVVIDRLPDDYFTCRPLGLPSFPLRTLHISEIRPMFSYAKLERSRRK